MTISEQRVQALELWQARHEATCNANHNDMKDLKKDVIDLNRRLTTVEVRIAVVVSVIVFITNLLADWFTK